VLGQQALRQQPREPIALTNGGLEPADAEHRADHPARALGAGQVDVDRLLENPRDGLRERHLLAVLHLAGELFEVRLGDPGQQSAQQALAVGEVVVERADAHARPARHAFQREGRRVAAVLEQLVGGHDDRVDHRPRPRLAGQLPVELRIVRHAVADGN